MYRIRYKSFRRTQPTPFGPPGRSAPPRGAEASPGGNGRLGRFLCTREERANEGSCPSRCPPTRTRARGGDRGDARPEAGSAAEFDPSTEATGPPNRRGRSRDPRGRRPRPRTGAGPPARRARSTGSPGPRRASRRVVERSPSGNHRWLAKQAAHRRCLTGREGSGVGLHPPGGRWRTTRLRGCVARLPPSSRGPASLGEPSWPDRPSSGGTQNALLLRCAPDPVGPFPEPSLGHFRTRNWTSQWAHARASVHGSPE